MNKLKDKEASQADMHLKLSAKFMAYKDLADRCLLNPDQVKKGEKRVFYMKPKSPFLQEPRIQNQFRNEFIRQLGQPPAPEPLTLLADDLHKAYVEKTCDKSNPAHVKDELCNFFKHRQYKLQHKRYKMQLRWAHHCLTSDEVDRAALKFNPMYSKLQFELENSVKRYARLEGTDHFLTPDRPAQDDDSSYADNEVRLPQSALRHDDIDVYLRTSTFEEKITRKCERFIERTKWTPMTHRFDIYQDSVEYFQSLRNESLKIQDNFVTQIKDKGNSLIDMKKLGDEGKRELEQIIQSKNIKKLEKKIQNARDRYMNTSKYNYEMPPMIFWNEVELKLGLTRLAEKFNVQGDMEIDNGHNFSYSVMVYFPQRFQHQAIQNQFAPYDAIPSLIDPANLAQQNIKKVLKRNQKKYGRTQGANTLLEVLEIQKHSKEMGVEFLNSIERSLFGEFNNAQLEDLPTVRVKTSDWVDLICFRPQLDNDQMYQASILSGEKRQESGRWRVDECLANMLEILNVQDVQNVNLIMESISQIHYDKVKYGSVKTDFLNFDPNDVDTFFTEDQKQFLSLFKACFQAKADNDPNNKGPQEISSSSIHEIPQHLLFANYLLQCLEARDQKTKLLYTLNTFRAVQRRLTIELREMGTRDKVLGDANLVHPMEQRADSTITDDETTDTGGSSPGQADGADLEDGGDGKERIDITQDPLIDINKYRFNGKLQNFLHSTCPVVPKFHASFGQPIDRQEISQDIDTAKNTDAKKQESKKFLGRVDKIYKHAKMGLNLVKDDFGIHVLYDATFADMRSMEIELLKMCSYYIGKAEPLLDNDLRNMYPAVDRLKILEEALALENSYQEGKLELINAYLECYEHISDLLEQQRLIQAIVDEMARRPRLNLSGSHFRDSYQAEINCLKVKTGLIREVMKMLMAAEFKENNNIRQYLEKSYRMMYEQMQGNWTYTEPEKLEKELNTRELVQTGHAGLRKAKDDMKLVADENGESVRRQPERVELRQRKIEAQEQASKIQSLSYKDAKDFAARLGIPTSNLEILLKDHHERDHLVRQSLHENVAFIKTSEGYPQFIYNNAAAHNRFRFTPQSEPIGILDFYESLHAIPRVVSAIQGAVSELNECHRPDNGLLTTSLELSTCKLLIAELKTVKNQDSLYFERSKGMEYLEDDSILGNSDKMLFFAKELAASADDPHMAQNPFVIGKLDMDAIEAFNFQAYQGYIDSESQYGGGNQGKGRKDGSEPEKITKRNFGRFYARIGGRTKDIKYPNMLTLSCNTVEAVRLRHTLLMTMEQTAVLEEVYNKQIDHLGQEGRIYFKDQFQFRNYVSNGGENFVNFIEEGPADEIQITLAINEFDRKIRSCVNFQDPECFKALIAPLGLEELRAVVQYEVMNLQALIVGTRTNQVLLDNSERKLREIDFFQQGFTVANPVFNVFEKLQGQNLFDSNLKKLPGTEKSATNSYVKTSVGEGYYNIIKRKQEKKELVEETFKRVDKYCTVMLKDQKIEMTQRQLRTLKLVLCHDYTQDILARIYCDSIKLQILKETDTLRKRVYLLPRESIFLELFPPRSGEHQFAAYNEDHQEELPREQTLFFSKQDNRIQSFWRLPQNHEIINIDTDIEQFKKINMPKNFDYDLGVPAEKTQPEFICRNSLDKIKEKLLSCKLTDSRDVDQVVKDKHRLVEFAEAFDFSQAGRAMTYLSYFKSISNIFDLEFFINKLASSANTISNVEKMVLSGVPFWEEGDDALFGDMDEEEESEEEPTSNQKQGAHGKGKNSKGGSDDNKFDEDGHKPLKNVLAAKVADKIAQEKEEKRQLRRELESITDRFLEYQGIMKKQEMAGSLQRAATFLQDIHHISFYGVLFTLYQMQDKYFTEGQGQSEIYHINEVVQDLSHQKDLKVTYLNGFHVNQAITATDRINLECSSLNRDFDSFFKATQPVIDEEALNPPEFNLISGLYLTNSINLITFKKNIPYMGTLIGRDYKCLDFALTNLSRPIRRVLMSYLNSNDLTLQGFIKARLKMDEKDYQSNPSIYSQILQEKKNYLKIQIKARQSRRIMMMIMSKQMLPLDIEEYNDIYREYHQEMHWKINHLTDQIASNRQASERELSTKRQKNPANVIMGSMKQNKESPVLKSYDHATSEIEVVHNELQQYMIKTAFNMLENETNVLAKTFEMTNIKLQAFVHPAQQFASTFHQRVDNRNHLDIINKVGPIQKMLTQIKNRCLEIETLTSGVGVVISSKDLNECLEECCRSLIKNGEIEMRTRCEHLSMSLLQYENLLYVKDRQLLNLENKLRTAKQEMNKIVNTKVFSRGNNLIYELDMTTRQLRLLKDNIFLLEKNLTEKIKLCYDRELDQERMRVADFGNKFREYTKNVEQEAKAFVRGQTEGITDKLQKQAADYKDLDVKTRHQQKFDEYKAKQVNINNVSLNIENFVINKDGSVGQAGQADPRLQEELETLQLNEREAREHVLRLQDIIRKYRIMNKFKEVLTAERHQYKIDNLKQQLTSNTTLWEQLAEGEKREKILKQEIERAQQEIATQEKIIERLKDDIKKEGREKQKLLQYKNTKSKRLDELETKAREFEVLSSVNLGKILGLLESKERKITSLSKTEENMNEYVKAMTSINNQEMKQVKLRANEETKYKMEAMTKLEGLRQELQMIQGNDQVSVNFWKEQCQSLFDICKNLKDDNEKLVENLGSLQETTAMGMGGLAHQDGSAGVHPLDQFQNNQDLLNYLNQTPRLNQGNAVQMGMSGGSFNGAGGHRRGNSQQSPHLSQYKTPQQREDYEKALYGMNKSLQDHMLGVNRKQSGSHHPSNSVSIGAAHASINSLGSESRDYMSNRIGGPSLPKINQGGPRNIGGAQYMTDSTALAGSLGSKLDRNRMMVAQQSPFMGKYPHGNELDGGSYGKMTPMYEKQQQMFGASQKRAGQLFGGGPMQGSSNVFSSLNGGHSVQNPDVRLPGMNIGDNNFHNNLSVDQTTMMTNNQSHMQQQSPSQNQASHDGGHQISTETGGGGANLLNFAAAPHTQRAPVNLDGKPDGLHGSSTDNHRQSNNTIDHFGGIGPSDAARSTKHSIDSVGKKKVQQEARLSLQPKLINPPSKLMKTLDHQGAKASHVKRKPQNYRGNFDE